MHWLAPVAALWLAGASRAAGAQPAASGAPRTSGGAESAEPPGAAAAPGSAAAGPAATAPRAAESATDPAAAARAADLRARCDAEWQKDEAWYRDLRNLFINQLFFDPRTGAIANPPPALPAFEPGYTSPMRDECTEAMRRDPKWMAELRAHFDGLLSYEFQERNASAAVKNNRHVVAAYAAILVLLVAFVVALFLRQRRLMADIERLREEVRRAADDGA
ncbi:MAG: hypothetical protein D6689_03895 [Deltaproteobacteria bacterium]|nr:MAG: hypothetical protein D6689_03895 [Deltaproteobacteria bacterium]